tara:strand:- start:1969 stop:2169 length:201 start_codon:yes stop_codon:yes gene_type:complete
MFEEQCKQIQNIAYNSCIDSYFQSKDKNDVYEYWLYLTEAKRTCEADGVSKALELITIIEDINAEN